MRGRKISTTNKNRRQKERLKEREDACARAYCSPWTSCRKRWTSLSSLSLSLLSLSDEFFFLSEVKGIQKCCLGFQSHTKSGTRAIWKRKKRSQKIFKFALSQTKRERDKEIKQRDKTEERKAHAHAIEVTRARAKPNRVRVSNGKKTQIQI